MKRIEFIYKVKNKILGKGRFEDDNWIETKNNKFILYKGAQLKPLRPDLVNSVNEYKTMIRNGIIKGDVLVSDYTFTSPSRAGLFIIGHECCGRDDFKDDNEKSINDYINEYKNKSKYIFNDDKIENKQINIITKRVPEDRYMSTAYIAPQYEELLLETAPAINLNHTSLKVSEKLCNALPDEFWNNENIWKCHILCMFSDSGFLEKYIIKKLMDNKYMRKKFPDYGMRVFWILHNMVFSIAKTNAASYWLRKIVYYSADTTIDGKNGDDYPAIFHGKLFTQGADKDKLESYHKYGNIKSPLLSDCGEDNIFNYPMLDWIKGGKDILEYVSRVFWDLFYNEKYEDIDTERRDKIMSEIKNKLDGYFDVIIGNPPYNTNNEETGAVGETVYNYFCLAADKLNPKYESFIIPSKWAYGKARIPNEFSQNVLKSKNVIYLELINGDDAFPSVSTGEISIYTKDNTKDSDKFIFNNYGKTHEYKEIKEITYETNGKRWIKPIDSIIEKVQAKVSRSLADDTKAISISSDNIYDIYGHDALDGAVAFKYDYGKDVVYPDGTKGKRPTYDYSLVKTNEFSMKFYIPKVKLWKKDKNGNYEYPNSENDKMMCHIYINPSLIKKWNDNKFQHEVLVTTTINDYHKRLLDYPYNAFIMKPGETTTKLIAIGRSLSTKEEVVNLQKFIKTKFATYLTTIAQVSQCFSAETVRFVPYMDFTQEWTDEKLNKFFDLDEDEIKRINDLWAEFRPMRRAQLQELEENIEEEGEDLEDNE